MFSLETRPKFSVLDRVKITLGNSTAWGVVQLITTPVFFSVINPKAQLSKLTKEELYSYYYLVELDEFNPFQTENTSAIVGVFENSLEPP